MFFWLGDLTPNIKGPIVSPDILVVALAEPNILRQDKLCAGLDCRPIAAEFSKGKLPSIGVFRNASVYEPSDVARRDLTNVADADTGNAFGRTALIVIPKWVDAAGTNGNIGAQLPRRIDLTASNQATGRAPQERRENPKTACSDNQTASECGYPPVWIRIPLALVLGLGSNGVLTLGILSLNNDRIGRGAALVGLGTAMFLGGISLMLALAFPLTWGWRI
jgi:hypothetical protein